MLDSLGATNLVEMANGNMETVYKQLADSGADKTQIEALRGAMDNRSTEQTANDHLAKIEANTSKTMVDSKGGGAGTIVAAASKESRELAESYDTLIKMFNSPDLATILGQAGAVGGALTTLKSPLDSLATGIPYLEKATTGLTAAIDKMSKVSIIGGTVTTITTKPIADASHNDALLMNDGVVQFNKADKFMKVSDSTMIAGTNVDGNKKLARAITTGGGTSIDYNQMAMAIVSAMKSATFVATVKPDLLFNGKKY